MKMFRFKVRMGDGFSLFRGGEFGDEFPVHLMVKGDKIVVTLLDNPQEDPEDCFAPIQWGNQQSIEYSVEDVEDAASTIESHVSYMGISAAEIAAEIMEAHSRIMA